MSDPNTPPPGYRPKSFPPPQFPPRRPALFARMPPAVFPVLMGALGLGLALRRGLADFGVAGGPAELILGLAVGLWAFAVTGYLIKLARRPRVLLEDLRILPGRAGLAAASLGLMLVAAVLVPYGPGLARGLLVAGLALHGALALLVLRLWLASPPEAREITPVWHLTFVGFILGGLSAVPLGMTGLAEALLWLTVPVALAIWAISALQLIRRIPPAPLRPLLAIHLAPASLFATVAASLGQDLVADLALLLAALIALGLLFAARWLTISGFSALWGAFTFPMAAFASALFARGLLTTGGIFAVLTLFLTGFVLWRVMQAWAKGSLAAKTNAAEA
ncbi:MAG TPA: tellurium resistance protein [Gemmobacter sp.]|nr:tellurium resistance protein [Gemmobacter sp.]